MNLDFDIPADLDTPVGAFLKLEPLRPRFLLESVGGPERNARYSFLGFGDGTTVRLADGQLEVDGSVSPAPVVAADLLAALRDALARAPRLGGDAAAQLPFRGGLVGACGFDLARRLSRLPNQPPADRGLEASFVAPRSVLVFDHLTHRACLLHDGTRAEHAALRREVVRRLRAPAPASQRATGWTPPVASLGRSDFVDGVRRAKAAIHDGDAYQLVLSDGFAGRSDVDPVQVYRALRQLNPSPYLFCLRLDDDTTVVGSSPEVLVAMDDRCATLRPIAGTRPRGADALHDAELEAELLGDPKEAAEHVMLVDLARNDLGRVAVPGTVAVAPSRIVERYSHVMHLVSGVRGVVEAPFDQLDLFAGAFPAGTVTGAPKTRAMELIAELEREPRGLYAGTVGYFGHGDRMDQAITIRTLVFRGDTYSYRAGAGIVADSDPGHEHDEVLAKARVLGEALRIAVEEL